MIAAAGLLLALAGALAGVVGPPVIARLPEPEDGAAEKLPYRTIAAAPRLGLALAVSGGVLGVATGFALGWAVALWPWLYVVPLGVVLSYIDLRTRLLPTRLIAPSYVIVVGLIGVAAAVDGSTAILVRAAVGWAVVGGLYFLPWLIYPKGVGYGDVRLSGVLGLALGCVGWPAVLVGAWLGLFLGGFSGLMLRPFTGLKMNAHAPAMVVGAVLGVVLGAPVLHALQR
ncbi:MAG: prepilin peptidase [Marmoricola sp.]